MLERFQEIFFLLLFYLIAPNLFDDATSQALNLTISWRDQMQCTEDYPWVAV